MELAPVIFQPLVLLVVVGAFYFATKYRRQWKGRVVWALGIAATLFFIGDEVKSYIDDRPTKEMGLWGIRLGAPVSQVKFLKGLPTEESTPERLIFRLKETGSVQSGRDILEESSGGTYVINFRHGKVSAIFYSGPKVLSPSIQGISLYSPSERLVERFGQPSYVLGSVHEEGRWYSFDDYNVAFKVEKNQIVALAVYDSLTGPVAPD